MVCNCKKTETPSQVLVRSLMEKSNTREQPSSTHYMDEICTAQYQNSYTVEECARDDCTCAEPIQEHSSLDKRKGTLNPSTFSVDLSILKEDHGIPRDCSQEELSRLIEETELFKGPQILTDDEDPFVIAMKALLTATKNDLKSAEIMLSHMTTYIQKAQVDLDNEKQYKRRQIKTITTGKIVVMDSRVFEDLLASGKLIVTTDAEAQAYDIVSGLRIRVS